MILPQHKYPLLEFADRSQVSQSLILKFIEDGGMDYMMNTWIAYSVDNLRGSKMLDGMSPVEALDLGRRIYEEISIDFQNQFKENSKEGVTTGTQNDLGEPVQ